ncbi:MAG TPA: hypothetical protein VGN60_08960 [Devosia sp.]|jgi:hypothetical protein|nr:hypothetical protein [Devosia sp.]
MALNSQPASRRILSAKRMIRDARLGHPMTVGQMERLETVLADAAADVERMELASGEASVVSQLKAAGNNPAVLRAVLQQVGARKAVRHG